jgi:hypothetical protein
MLSSVSDIRNQMFAPTMDSQHSYLPTVSEGHRTRVMARLCVLLILFLGLTMGVAQPAMADHNSGGSTTNPICQDKSHTLAQMIEGVILITVSFGPIGLLLALLVGEIKDMATFSREQKAKAKEFKRSAARSGVAIMILPAIIVIFLLAIGVPNPQCVDLIPF